MDWKVLIIGLIPLGVWILSTIFRGIEDAREQEKPRPAPGERPLRTPRRPSSELDRFLDEARKRREVAPKRPAEEPVLEALPVPKPPPPRVEAPPPRPREPRRPEPAPPPVVALPVELPPAPPAPARLPPRAQPSPALAKVVAMLRGRDAVATAVALREILDRPLSQRPR